MKVSMVTVVVLLTVTLAFWIGQAEAQHRGGGAKPPAAHPPKAAARPPAGKMHPPQPKGKAQPQLKGVIAKVAAQKKQMQKNSAEPKKKVEKKEHEKKARKEETAKKKAMEHAKKAEKKAPAAGADHESIALLHAAHHKLHEADHDYGGHRHRAIEHVGSALHHLGSSPEATGMGRANTPQSVSDAIMREARGSLEKVGARLASGKAATHGHAREAVNAAVREIDLALTVR